MLDSFFYNIHFENQKKVKIMLALLIISMICCLAYPIGIIFKYGVPVSLSETFYLLPQKWRWLFSAWCVMTAAPAGIYWFSKAPDNLKWMPIVCMIGLLFIAVSCDYKAPVPKIAKGNLSQSKSILELIKSFSFKEMFKYGWTKPLHYINSLIAIILSTTYLCIVNQNAIASTAILYPMFIIIGMRVDGVYNPDYSADVDNRAWIFFMEIVCFCNLYTYLLF